MRYRGRRRKAPPAQSGDGAPGKPGDTEQRGKPAATHTGRAESSGVDPETQSSGVNPLLHGCFPFRREGR